MKGYFPLGGQMKLARWLGPKEPPRGRSKGRWVSGYFSVS